MFGEVKVAPQYRQITALWLTLLAILEVAPPMTESWSHSFFTLVLKIGLGYCRRMIRQED